MRQDIVEDSKSKSKMASFSLVNSYEGSLSMWTFSTLPDVYEFIETAIRHDTDIDWHPRNLTLYMNLPGCESRLILDRMPDADEEPVVLHMRDDYDLQLIAWSIKQLSDRLDGV